jgi:hypothetical protein
MRITLTTPASTLETAKRASQALDEDCGGYLAFQTQDEQGNYTYSVELPEGYPEQIAALMADANLLHSFITQQLTTRFPDDPIPSLGDCEALCAAMVLS